MPFLLILSSCNKYLDVEPKGKHLLKTANDFDLWLNSTTLAQAIPNELNLPGDDVDNIYITLPITGSDTRIYTWQPQYSDDPSTSPVIWKDFYEAVYYYNTVLLGIDEAIGTDQQKKSLKAEALLGRAFSYLYLVNLYGRLYNANTAGTDLSVPFVVSNDLNVATPGRSTVKDIYDHIIADLTAAIPDLPKTNTQNRFRGTVAGAYSVLARAYLYKGDFDNAGKNAQLALDNGQTTGLDYSTMSSPASIPALITRPGAIYARLLKTTFTQYQPTLAFLKTFDTKDLRLAFYYTNLGNYSFQKRGDVVHLGIGVTYSGAYPNCGTSVEEMRLIIAEAAARANDLPKALTQLDLVRKTRFKPADYQVYSSTVQADVLQKILTERTFELAYVGMRWFDMKRLDAESRMPGVTRYDGQGNIIATLAPHSDKYTLQIPLQIMYFNPGWPQNP